MIPYTASELVYEDYGPDVTLVDTRIKGEWRWGVRKEMVFEHDGQFYGVDYVTQPEEGIIEHSITGPHKLERVEKIIHDYVKV